MVSKQKLREWRNLAIFVIALYLTAYAFWSALLYLRGMI